MDPDSRAAEKDSSPNMGLRILAGFGLGAGLMYLYDPQSGRRRRALIGDQMEHTMRKLQEAERMVVHDASQRAIGLMAQARRIIEGDGPADDVVLAERVRAALGRGTSHPGAIEVTAIGGTVCLSGPILAEERDILLDCVSKVRGVESVDNQLTLHHEADGIPALQGGEPLGGARGEWMRENWSPSTRVLAGAAGAALAAAGMLRGGLGGWLLGMIGGALFTRAAANRGLASLAGGGDAGRTADALLPVAFEPAQGRFEQAPPSDARH
jgi:hypothetical protein